MSPRTTGHILAAFAVLSGAAHWGGLHVPVLKIPFLAATGAAWVLLAVLFVAGGWLSVRGARDWQFSPLTLKQFKRFRSIHRGHVSFLLLLILAGVASLDNLVVGKQALLVHYNGGYYVPFVKDEIPGKTFGLNYDAETDYRDLQKTFREEGKGNWLVMPVVPFDAKLDSPEIIVSLEQRGDGVFMDGDSKPFSGRAYTVFQSKPTQKRQEFVYRHGVRSGEMRGWDEMGEQIEKGRYEEGRQTSYSEYKEGVAKALESAAAPGLRSVVYPPSPPSWRYRHFLGTNSAGGDVLAILFGGLQQALIAALLYTTVVFTVGIVVGGTLGYFGGLYDLIGQRLIEIWSVLPFLFIVMIISSVISPTLVILVGIIALFGWMGTTTYLRTATYREKTRDYVAAVRLQGASTGRIIFRHVLPNVIAILVTLAPFEISGVITALSALDYLNFGLPPDEPSWGRLLQEGTENFNYPWIVSSAFAALVIVLLLVTFVGEAVREAFDPKKFTTYE